MYKDDLVLNNLQWLICHKTKPNQTIKASFFRLSIDSLYFLQTTFHILFLPVVILYVYAQQAISCTNELNSINQIN